MLGNQMDQMNGHNSIYAIDRLWKKMKALKKIYLYSRKFDVTEH